VNQIRMSGMTRIQGWRILASFTVPTFTCWVDGKHLR
jgi:hypothetical protein